MRQKSNVVFIVALTACAGCTSQQELLEQFFSDLHDARCDYLFRCCGVKERASFLGATMETTSQCKQYFATLSTVTSHALQLASSEEAIEVDTSATKVCLAAIQIAKCDRSPSLAISPKDCDLARIITGLREEGEACYSAHECDEDTRCALSSSKSGTTKGVCVPLLGNGEPCIGTSAYGGAVCEDGRQCVRAAKSGVRRCTTLAKVGEPCGVVPCETSSGLFCSGKSASDAYCLKQKTNGESCQSSVQCRSEYCGSLGSGSGGICLTRKYSGICGGSPSHDDGGVSYADGG